MSKTKYTTGTKVNGRAVWQARPMRASHATQTPPTEAFLHITDNPDGRDVLTGAQRATAMRQIQRFHQDDRGWADIGYHYVVFQGYGGPLSTDAPVRRRGEPLPRLTTPATAGQVFAGRPSSVVPAAQAGHNTGTLAIAVYAAPGDAITTRTLYLIESLITAHPTVRTVGGHRDVTATDCPGPHLYAQVPRVAHATGRAIFRHA